MSTEQSSNECNALQHLYELVIECAEQERFGSTSGASRQSRGSFDSTNFHASTSISASANAHHSNADAGANASAPVSQYAPSSDRSSSSGTLHRHNSSQHNSQHNSQHSSSQQRLLPAHVGGSTGTLDSYATDYAGSDYSAGEKT